MRKAWLDLICLGLCVFAGLPEGTPRLEFRAPSFDAPFYRIRIPFEAPAEGSVAIRKLEINGVETSSYLAFQNGRNIPLSKPLEKGFYTVVLDYAWEGGKKYEVRIFSQQSGKAEQDEWSLSGISPAEGGIPGGEEGFCRIYQLEEPIGLERRREVVTLALTVPKAEIEGSAFVIFDGRKSLPYEILERRDSFPPPAASRTHPSTSTLKIALQADAGARQKKMILVLKGTGAPKAVPGFIIAGEGLGKSVKGSKLALEFHPKSGQVNTIASLDPAVRLYNKAGVIHWNPDVFVPGVGWDHSFDWNPPAEFEEKAGSFLYLNSRRGPLPRVQGVRLEVKYALPAGAPYFISETRLDFAEDKGVIAVRNDEMVLFRELFDMLLYRDTAGRVIRLPLTEKAGMPFGLSHIAPEDLDWVGLVNSREGFGFFSLRLSSANGNLKIPGEFFLRPGTYFYAPSDGNYVYWVRPLIYTWGDHFTSGHLTFVPDGSFFYEKNAYVIMPLGPDLPRRLDSMCLMLRNPLRVF